ncbi:hypothetical protein ASZ90_002835 [hydrocarbon metagenome]|uniref:Uncharacterized protein n=1 Tax=hydrocarbon metagenome TaxID=938273 RepID=A0A0W8G2D3_9ZZZZ
MREVDGHVGWSCFSCSGAAGRHQAIGVPMFRTGWGFPIRRPRRRHGLGGNGP